MLVLKAFEPLNPLPSSLKKPTSKNNGISDSVLPLGLGLSLSCLLGTCELQTQEIQM